MDEVFAALIIMLFIAVGWHYAVHKYFAAIFGSVLSSVVLFQLAVIITVGYFDPFFMAALSVLAVVATFISLIIGIPFLLSRKKKKTLL